MVVPQEGSMDTDKILYRIVGSPVGEFIAGATSKGCCVFEFHDRGGLDRITARVEKRYGVAMSPGSSSFVDQLESQVREYFDGKRPKKFRSPFRNVDDEEEKQGMEGYEEGMVFMSASSTRRPGVVGPDAKTRIEAAEDIYPGCYCRATVVAFAYDVKGNKGVSFGLNNVQKVREGEPLGSFSRAEDDFDEVEDWDKDGSDAAPGDSDGMFA